MSLATMEVTQSVFNARCRGEDADMDDIVYDLSLGRAGLSCCARARGRTHAHAHMETAHAHTCSHLYSLLLSCLAFALLVLLDSFVVGSGLPSFNIPP